MGSYIGKYSASRLPQISLFLKLSRLWFDLQLYFTHPHLLPILQAPRNPRLRWHRFHPYQLGISLGEVLLWCSFLMFVIFWVCYFRVVWSYLNIKLANEYDQAQTEMAARMLGHMLNLFSAFLLIPASGTGLLVEVFAVPYERTIKYHRILGYITFLLMTSHAMTWWCKWLREGNLGHNIVEYNSLLISVDRYNTQDFTIPIMETVWFLMGISIVMAVVIRRRYYEIFQYPHKFIGIIFYVSAIAHAWSFW